MTEESQVKPWHEQDAFWQTMADKMFAAAQWEQAAIEVDQILALAEVPAGASALDLCCGPGRHSFELARRGFVVKGVDRTRSYYRSNSGKSPQKGAVIHGLFRWRHEDLSPSRGP